MAASVVSFSVQNGSAGYTIARQVAEKLGFRYYDWEITSEAARLAGVPPANLIAAEHVPGFLERTMRRLGAISSMSIEGSGFNEPSPDTWNTALQSLTSEDYRHFIEQVVMRLAGGGDAVIVGHASQHLLRDSPGVLKVMTLGSLPVRAQRHATEQSISLEAATRAIKQSDRDRHDLLRRVYHFEWTDASTYDLTLNTDHISQQRAVETIAAAARDML